MIPNPSKEPTTMDVTKVTNEDALRAGQLANFLKHGKWQMDGEQAAAYALAIRWFHGLCTAMAAQLPAAAPRAAAPAAPAKADAPIKVTGMGVGSKKIRKGK